MIPRNPADIEEAIRRQALREFYKFELRSQVREWKIRLTGSAWIFLAFSITYLNAEMIKAICILGFITAFGLHLFSWAAMRNVSRELEGL